MHPRVIARLDIKGNNLIKGIHLEGLRVMGNPAEFALEYYNQGVDELLLMDSVASLYGRNNLVELIAKTAQRVFIPVTAGGGIRSNADVEKLLLGGADKVSVNTAAVARPELLSEISLQFGSQCLVLSVEARKTKSGWEAMTDNGRESSGRDAISWIEEAVSLGVGEVLLTSVDREGTREGFDLELLKAASEVCSVPLIASGGLGEASDAYAAVSTGKVDAVAVADGFHYGRVTYRDIRNAIQGQERETND